MLNFQYLSLTFLISYILIDPGNSLKISLCHFLFNLILSLTSLMAPKPFISLIESSLPFKTSIIGVLSFSLFQYIPIGVMSAYEGVIGSIEPIYAIFEVLQVINVVFMGSRWLKGSMEFGGEGQGVDCSLPVVLALGICISNVGVAVWVYWGILSEGVEGGKLIWVGLCVGIWVMMMAICLIGTKVDSNVMNSCVFGLFLAFACRLIVKKNISWNSGISTFNEQSENTSFLQGFLSKAYLIQKRISNYLSSFILGGNPGYNIAGFFEFSKKDNLISLVIGILCLLTLPLTKHEWLNTEEEESEEDPKLQPQDIRWEDRKSQCFYYLINAVLVLISTSYSLKTLDYGSYTENAYLSLFSSLCTPIIGLAYFTYKIIISEEDDD